MIRRILRWEVPVDDEWHGIGAGRVVHVGDRPPQFPHAATGDRVEVWTEEDCPDDFPKTEVEAPRLVRVFGTAQPLPDEARAHVGSALSPLGRLVWHVYAQDGQMLS